MFHMQSSKILLIILSINITGTDHHKEHCSSFIFQQHFTSQYAGLVHLWLYMYLHDYLYIYLPCIFAWSLLCIRDGTWYFYFGDWLISLSIMVSIRNHFVANCVISFFLKVEQCSIEQIYHGFFTNSSFDGHLDCFPAFTTVDCVTTNIGSQVTFACEDCISFGYILRSGYLGHMADSFPIVWALSILIPIAASLAYEPTSSEEGYFSFHILPVDAVSRVLNRGQSLWS